MTYTQIGNYGINEADREHPQTLLAGFIVREQSRIYSNFRATGSLSDYLKENGVIGLAGIDTRSWFSSAA